MGSVILGIFIGLLVSLVIGFIGYVIYEALDLSYEIAGIIDVVVTIVLCIIATVAITLAVCSYDKLQSTCYIDRYHSVKTTIEDSLDSDKISGMERLQLVQNAIDQNMYLTQQQFDCRQWYGFLIDKGVLELEPINFE